MRHFDIRALDIEPHQPHTLRSDPGEDRALAIQLSAGEDLLDHEVHERGYIVVVSGTIQVGGEPAEEGSLLVFDRHDRHAVRAASDARLLLILASGPGPDQPDASERPAAA